MQNKFIIFLPNGFGDLVMASYSLSIVDNINEIYLVVKSRSHSDLLVSIGIKCNFIFLDTKKFKSILNFIFKFGFRNNTIIAPLLSSKIKNQFILSFFFNKLYCPNALYKSNKILNLDKFSQKGNIHLVDYFKYFFYKSHLITSYNYNNNSFLLKKPSTHFKKNMIGIGLSCGFDERHKIPKPEVFSNFMNTIPSYAFNNIILYGLYEDLHLLELFKKNSIHKNKIKFELNLSFTNIFNSINECNVFISGTTGQAHIASITNIPMVIFCGVTNDLSSGPYCSNKLIIKHDLICGPCYEENYLYGCGKKCMDDIFNNNNAMIFKNYILNQLN